MSAHVSRRQWLRAGVIAGGAAVGILNALGSWMNVHGDSIYGTTQQSVLRGTGVGAVHEEDRHAVRPRLHLAGKALDNGSVSTAGSSLIQWTVNSGTPQR